MYHVQNVSNYYSKNIQSFVVCLDFYTSPDGLNKTHNDFSITFFLQLKRMMSDDHWKCI